MGIDKIGVPSETTEATLPFLDGYRSSILEAFSFEKKRNESTKKRNKYELEMFSRLAYDYEQLEEMNQENFKITIEELLQVDRASPNFKKPRKEFLENWKNLLPVTFEYQNNDYRQSCLPRKASLQSFYDQYLDNWDEESYSREKETRNYSDYN